MKVASTRSKTLRQTKDSGDVLLAALDRAAVFSVGIGASLPKKSAYLYVYGVTAGHLTCMSARAASEFFLTIVFVISLL